MPAYNYRAVDPSGVIIEGNLEAANERALETQLRQSDIELLRCVEKSAGRFGRKRAVKRKDLIGFCFHMQQMTRAGLPILEALADLRDSVEHPVFKEVIANGNDLSHPQLRSLVGSRNLKAICGSLSH